MKVIVSFCFTPLTYRTNIHIFPSQLHNQSYFLIPLSPCRCMQIDFNSKLYLFTRFFFFSMNFAAFAHFPSHHCFLFHSHAHWPTAVTLLAIVGAYMFIYLFKTYGPPNSATSSSCRPMHKDQEGWGEGGNSNMRGPALLSALHQETECERAARHHTEALLKIHVYHSSSFIDGLSSLYVYEVSRPPVALVSDPPWVHRGVQETACSL